MTLESRIRRSFGLMDVQERVREEEFRANLWGLYGFTVSSENWIILVLVMIYSPTANIRASNAVDQSDAMFTMFLHAQLVGKSERTPNNRRKEPLYFISF